MHVKVKVGRLGEPERTAAPATPAAPETPEAPAAPETPEAPVGLASPEQRKERGVAVPGHIAAEEGRVGVCAAHRTQTRAPLHLKRRSVRPVRAATGNPRVFRPAAPKEGRR